MNALARIDATAEIDPVFATLGEIAATVSESSTVLEPLRKVLALLARHGLTEGGVALVEGEFLRGLSGRHSEAPAQGLTPRLKKFLKQGEAGVLRNEQPPTIGAPIRMRDEIVGLLATRVVGRPVHDADVRLLAFAANLLGPTLARARSGAPRPQPPAPDPRKIVGDSKLLRNALDQALRMAPTNLPVLLRGESGCGKELFAHFIHDHSPRKTAPFIKVNCAALPETLLESEVFGHERGAFTGAEIERKGRFELADGGTLLLDEIGDISQPFQAKLLRAVQEGEFERVGGSQTLKVAVRVIAATHRDLEQAVRDGRFRADLYYRLAVAPIALPALRDRREDIPALAAHILARFNAENGRTQDLNPRAVELLCKCAFPGNVRELENCLRGAAAMAGREEIRECDFACRQGRCFSARLRRAQLARTRIAEENRR
jgi:Nif-specific regulatory protein